MRRKARRSSPSTSRRTASGFSIVRVRRSCSSRKTNRTPSACSVSQMRTSYVKDGINDYVVHGATEAVNPAGVGTKSAARYALSVPAGGRAVLQLRLTDTRMLTPVRRGIRPHVRRSASRGRRVLRHGHPRPPERRRQAGDAAGVRRPAVDEAVLPLHHSRLAQGGSDAAPLRQPIASTAATTPGFSCTTPT